MEQITLCANDEPSFRKIVDVLHDCFGKNYVGYQEVSGTSILKKWHGSLKFHRLNKMDIIPQETMDG